MCKILEFVFSYDFKLLLWIFAIFSALFAEVHGLKCVQCSNLVEDSMDRCLTGSFPATECSVNETSCIKYEGESKGRKFIFRQCDDQKVPDVCGDKSLANEIVPTCSYRCFTDGCNEAAKPRQSPVYIVYSVLALLYQLMC